jgi:hypothetical protein
MYGVDTLASYNTLSLPCYILYLYFTFCISHINDSVCMGIHEFFVLGGKHKVQAIISIQVVPEGIVNILGGHSIGHSKQKSAYVHVSYSERFPRFHRTVAKLLIRKRYYVLFLIPVFIVQMTKLVQFTSNNTFSKIPPSKSMHSATRVRHMACWSSGCILTFLYEGDNLHYVIKQFVSFIHFSSVHFTLRPSP